MKKLLPVSRILRSHDTNSFRLSNLRIKVLFHPEKHFFDYASLDLFFMTEPKSRLELCEFLAVIVLYQKTDVLFKYLDDIAATKPEHIPSIIKNTPIYFFDFQTILLVCSFAPLQFDFFLKLLDNKIKIESLPSFFVAPANAFLIGSKKQDSAQPTTDEETLQILDRYYIALKIIISKINENLNPKSFAIAINTIKAIFSIFHLLPNNSEIFSRYTYLFLLFHEDFQEGVFNFVFKKQPFNPRIFPDSRKRLPSFSNEFITILMTNDYNCSQAFKNNLIELLPFCDIHLSRLRNPQYFF